MKIKDLLCMGLVSALVFTSCANNDDFSEWNDGTQPIKFTSSIQGMTTKATDAQWAEGDEVGIFMKAGNADLSSAISSNKKFLTSAAGVLSAATAGDALYYPADGSDVDFVAYYPYTASLSGTTYSVDVANQENQAAIDLLYSNNAKGLNKESGSPALTFSHKLAKIVMNIETDGSIQSLSGLAVSLNGFNTKADFSLVDGTLSNAGTTAAINMLVNEAARTAEAIIVPGNQNSAKVSFSLNGITKEAAIPTSTFEGGNKYIYTVKLSHSGEVMSIQFGESTITDWTDVPSGNIDVDFNEGTETPEEGIVITADKPFVEEFLEDQGDFTIDNKVLPEGTNFVWRWDSYHCMKASAFISGVKYPSESWLISPAFDLSQTTNPVLSFEHTQRYATNVTEELSLWVKETGTDNWQQIEVSNFNDGSDWTFVTTTIDLKAYVGKTINFAYKYVSTATSSATWEVTNIKVSDGESGGEDPEPTTENIVTNPGFEDWTGTLPTGWDNSKYTTGEVVKETSIVYEGSNSLRQTSASGTNKVQQEVAVTGGQKYIIRYRFLDNDTKASSRYWFAWVAGSSSLNEESKEIQQQDYSKDSADWQTVEMEVTAPATATKLRYEVRTYRNMDTNEAGGYIYYDNMELIPVK